MDWDGFVVSPVAKCEGPRAPSVGGEFAKKQIPFGNDNKKSMKNRWVNKHPDKRVLRLAVLAQDDNPKNLP